LSQKGDPPDEPYSLPTVFWVSETNTDENIVVLMRNFHFTIASLNNNIFFHKFIALAKVGPGRACMLHPGYYDYFHDHDKNATKVL
jgi:hypothetical protein